MAETEQNMSDVTETDELNANGETPEADTQNQEVTVTPQDILNALHERDSHGENLTTITFTLEMIDIASAEVVDQLNTITTNEPVMTIFDIGGYPTIRVTYRYNNAPNLGRMITILEDFASLLTKFAYAEEGQEKVPRLTVTIKPMSVRGATITAVNPIFHNIQPHDPLYPECNELQMLFDQEMLGFYYDPNFDDEAVSDQVRAEIAAEESIRVAAEKKKTEQEEYQKEREREMQQRMAKQYGTDANHVIKTAYHGYGKDRDKEEEQ